MDDQGPISDLQVSEAWENLQQNHPFFYVVFRVLLVVLVVYLIWSSCSPTPPPNPEPQTVSPLP
jgi:hypothetical protein